MSRTVAQIEEALSIRVHDYITGVASSNGAADGTTVLATSEDILSRAGESFVPFLLEITSGTYDTQVRRITDCTIASGVATFTVLNAFGGQILAAVTFRVHRIAPAEKIRAISSALGEIHDVLPRVIAEYLLVGELLANANLEQWRGDIPYDWVTGASGTVTRETSTVYQGESALKLADANGVVRQRISLERDVEDETLVFTKYVNGKITNGARIGITANGTTTYSDALAADDTWEQLSVEVEITSGVQPIYAVLAKGSGSEAGYFDAGHLIMEDQERVDLIPISEAFQSVRQIRWRKGVDPDADPSQLDYSLKAYDASIAPTALTYDGYMRYPGTLAPDHFLAVVGVGVWPTVDALTDVVDIIADEEPLVAVRAGLKLMSIIASGDYLSDGSHWAGIEADLLREEARLVSRLRRRAPTKHLNVPVR